MIEQIPSLFQFACVLIAEAIQIATALAVTLRAALAGPAVGAAGAGATAARSVAIVWFRR
jgi:uncharacterized metal-binding protein